jgi:hypothetical protein
LRSLELLEEARWKVPARDQRRFWRELVEGDHAFDGLRRNPRFSYQLADLKAKYLASEK